MPRYTKKYPANNFGTEENKKQCAKRWMNH